MLRSTVVAVCLVFAAAGAGAQKIEVYQTTPDILEALSQRESLYFDKAAFPGVPMVTVDDAQRFQEIDGFGASLTDAAAWLFARKLTPSGPMRPSGCSSRARTALP
jgi:glucosylceramidase